MFSGDDIFCHRTNITDGDCLVFGGSARLMFHGLQEIEKNSAPPLKLALPGRIGVILK